MTASVQHLVSEENEWLPESKLKNATDVVQDYLNELSNKGRPAARVGRPDLSGFVCLRV